MLHPQNQLENSKMDPLLEEVLSIQDVKPEGCSDQEFLDGVRPMGDYTNFTLMNPYLMFTHSGVENSYTSEAEFIAQMQQHFQTSEFAMLSYEEYKKQHIEKHYA